MKKINNKYILSIMIISFISLIISLISIFSYSPEEKNEKNLINKKEQERIIKVDAAVTSSIEIGSVASLVIVEYSQSSIPSYYVAHVYTQANLNGDYLESITFTSYLLKSDSTNSIFVNKGYSDNDFNAISIFTNTFTFSEFNLNIVENDFEIHYQVGAALITGDVPGIVYTVLPEYIYYNDSVYDYNNSAHPEEVFNALHILDFYTQNNSYSTFRSAQSGLFFSNNSNYDKGYDKGYIDGLNSSSDEFSLDWLIEVFRVVEAFLDVELLPGFTIKLVILIPLVLSLLYALLKMLR